uniref:Otogelin n=1 Tax=Callorhinchus milii TaxID=7868 RepID=A0A4W3IMF1_CALMI
MLNSAHEEALSYRSLQHFPEISSSHTLNVMCCFIELCSPPCLNGGVCVNRGKCDCRESGANGTRCQTGNDRTKWKLQWCFFNIKTNIALYSNFVNIREIFKSFSHLKLRPFNECYNRDLICRTWGQYNYETFDGLYYYYPGNCTYTLVRECQQSEHSFLIQVRGRARCLW